MALAVDLALGIKIVDHESDDLHDLRVGECGFVGVEVAEAFDPVFLEHIEQFKLISRKFCFDVIRLTHKADVDARVGAGKHEELIRKEEGGVDRKGMGLGADETGDGEANRTVAVVDDLQLTFAAGAFQLDHIGREIEETDGCHDAAAAVGTAVGHGGALFVQYHRSSFLPARGFPLGAVISVRASTVSICESQTGRHAEASRPGCG